MKNPLTSKERRGLTAVAAAALLCIAAGFIFRSCSSCSRNGSNATPIIVADNDSIPSDSIYGNNDLNNADSSLTSIKPEKRKNNRSKAKASDKKKKGKSSQKKKTEKVYPTRDPLSQPCD